MNANKQAICPIRPMIKIASIAGIGAHYYAKGSVRVGHKPRRHCDLIAAFDHIKGAAYGTPKEGKLTLKGIV